MNTRKCTKCGEVKELSSDNFHRNKSHKHGLTSACKVCMAEYQRLRREKIKLDREKYKEDRKADALRKEKEEEIVQVKTEVFKTDTKYKIQEMASDRRNKKHYTESFEGQVVYQDKRLLTLKNDKGVAETFLKMDFITGDYKYKEVV